MRALVLVQPEPRLTERLAAARSAIKSAAAVVGSADIECFGIATSTLSPIAIDKEQFGSVKQTDLIVFSSPFSVQAVWPQIEGIITQRAGNLPTLGLIGPGSATVSELEQGIGKRCPKILPASAPFDAEQLASTIRAMSTTGLSGEIAQSNSRAINLLVIQGDRSGTTTQQWQDWLGERFHVHAIQGYETLARDVESQMNSLAIALDAVTPKQLILYITAASAVAEVAAAFKRSGLDRFQHEALVIHDRIDSEVRLHLRCPCRVIQPGLQALLNCVL